MSKNPILKTRSRLNKPVAENVPALKNVLKEIKGQAVTVEDFVLLVSPHLGDKGAALTKAMTSDLNTFRKMVIQVYDTMTQDVSDVLANEQMDLARLYAERQRILVEKTMRALREINEIAPDFNFEQFYADRDKYLAAMFKMAEMPDDEEIETVRRHVAYHRLQWLRSESERLQAENQKLQERLTTLKKVQREEILEQIAREREEEEKKAKLEQEQIHMQKQLEHLNVELQKTIVDEEKKKTAAKRSSARQRQQLPTFRLAKKSSRAVPWSAQAAADIERTHIAESQASVASKTRRAPARKRVATPRMKKSTLESRPEWQDVDVEEFQPRTPSPVKASSPVRSAARSQSCRCPSPPPGETYGRRVRGPQDTWRGFQ